MGGSRLTLLGWGPILATLVPLIIYEYLRSSTFDPMIGTPFGHFVVVTAASLMASLFAVLVGVVGHTQRNIQVTFLSLSFTSLAFLITLHGLSTPGFILPGNPVPGIAAQFSVFVASIWLAMSSLSSDSRPIALLGRRPGLLVAVWTSLMAIIVLLGLLRPQLWSAVPVNSPPLLWFVAAMTIVLTFIAAWRYWQSYIYSRMPLPHAIVYAGVWILAAQWIMATSEIWRLSWWLYHYLLVAAVLALLVGISRQYLRGPSFQDAVRGMLLADPIERLEVGLSPSVQALVLATEARDVYTAGHSYRVALTAVRIGQVLRLSPHELRALAVGGLVHDVGKLEVPDSILNKPDRLTASERRTIEQHPVSGHQLTRHLGFMENELAIIRHHHERWDGSGYPDNLAGEAIPKLARILAVADVYDALTSARSYRDPWSHEHARRFILDKAGTSFDPHCVAAWTRLTTEGPVVKPGEMAPWSNEAPEAVSAT